MATDWWITEELSDDSYDAFLDMFNEGTLHRDIDLRKRELTNLIFSTKIEKIGYCTSQIGSFTIYNSAIKKFLQLILDDPNFDNSDGYHQTCVEKSDLLHKILVSYHNFYQETESLFYDIVLPVI